VNREVRPAPQPVDPAEARESRIRVALAFGSALILVSALGCCCLGSALVAGTDDGHQTRSRHHGH
jgi:hypothetical protein